MVTILWCYARNNAFVKDNVDYNSAADITGQANYLGVSLQADITKNHQQITVDLQQLNLQKLIQKCILNYRPPYRLMQVSSDELMLDGLVC
jgi:DhnA family fructose-bisphosphate aldolase class Ia